MRLEGMLGTGSIRTLQEFGLLKKKKEFLTSFAQRVVEIHWRFQVGSEDLEAKCRTDWEKWEVLTSPIGMGWQW